MDLYVSFGYYIRNVFHWILVFYSKSLLYYVYHELSNEIYIIMNIVCPTSVTVHFSI